MATDSKLMTADELLRLPDDEMRHELIAGELTTMAPSDGQDGRVTEKVTTWLAHGARVVYVVNPRGARRPSIVQARRRGC